MKASKTLLLSIILLITHTAAFTQHLEATTYIEKTNMSPKAGTRIGYHFENNFEVGGFYQSATETLEAEPGRPLMAEQNFYGAYVMCPIKVNEKSFIKMNIRTGVTNGQNFTITPSVHAGMKAFKKVTAGVGIGIRSMNPTYMASLKVRI